MNLWLLAEGNDGWRDSYGVSDGHVHTAVFGMDNKQGFAVLHMDFCLMLCDSLDGREVWGRVDTGMCMAEFLCC